MSIGEQDQSTVVGLGTLHFDGCGDAQRLLAVLLFASVDEVDLAHEVLDEFVLNLGLGLVFGSEDGLLPDFVSARGALDEIFVLECVLDQAGHDELQRVVGRLSGLGGLFGRVADDSIGWFVDSDFDILDRVDVVQQLRVLLQQLEHAVQCTCGLVFVETEFEVHVHQGEVGASSSEGDVEGGGVAFGGLVQSEQSLRVSEHVLRAHEAFLGSVAR